MDLVRCRMGHLGQEVICSRQEAARPGQKGPGEVAKAVQQELEVPSSGWNSSGLVWGVEGREVDGPYSVEKESRTVLTAEDFPGIQWPVPGPPFLCSLCYFYDACRLRW